LITPTWPFNSLAQQDAYITNPFLYHGISAAYDQWSHTVMGEARWQPIPDWEPYLNLEVLRRYARSQTVPKMVMYTADGARAPGRTTRAYFETGLRWYPWHGLPHRGSFAVTNHGLNVGETVTTPVEDRVKRGLYYLARVEAWL